MLVGAAWVQPQLGSWQSSLPSFLSIAVGRTMVYVITPTPAHQSSLYSLQLSTWQMGSYAGVTLAGCAS
jgi:hypothetical protein